MVCVCVCEDSNRLKLRWVGRWMFQIRRTVLMTLYNKSALFLARLIVIVRDQRFDHFWSIVDPWHLLNARLDSSISSDFLFSASHFSQFLWMCALSMRIEIRRTVEHAIAEWTIERFCTSVLSHVHRQGAFHFERSRAQITNERPCLRMLCHRVPIQQHFFLRHVVALVTFELHIAVQDHVRAQAAIVHQPLAALVALHLTLFAWSMYRWHVLIQAGARGEILCANMTHIRFVFFHVRVYVPLVCWQTTRCVVTAIGEKFNKSIYVHTRSDLINCELTLCRTNGTRTCAARWLADAKSYEYSELPSNRIACRICRICTVSGRRANESACGFRGTERASRCSHIRRIWRNNWMWIARKWDILNRITGKLPAAGDVPYAWW